VYGEPVVVLEKLKASDVVLDQKRDDPHIGMGLETEGEVRLRAGRVIADGNVLVQLTHGFLDARRSQP
jgi:hypothetical protein